MFVVGRPGNIGALRSGEGRHQRDQGRGAGGSDDLGRVGHRPHMARGGDEAALCAAIGQGRPGLARHLTHRIGNRVDPRGQVEPVGPGAAMRGDGRIEPATMVALCHACGRGMWRLTKWPLTPCGQSRNGTWPVSLAACRRA